MKKSLAVGAGVFLAFGSLSPALAAEEYRYWSYWHVEAGSWALSDVGAGSHGAETGQVQGWRFIAGPVTPTSELAPRALPEFSEVCTAKPTSTKVAQVAIVIDFGSPSDYVNGESPPKIIEQCVEVDLGSPSSFALAQIAEVREDNGFVCALNRLPAQGCADVVRTDTSSESTGFTFAGMVAVVILAASLLSRRRKKQ